MRFTYHVHASSDGSEANGGVLLLQQPRVRVRIQVVANLAGPADSVSVQIEACVWCLMSLCPRPLPPVKTVVVCL